MNCEEKLGCAYIQSPVSEENEQLGHKRTGPGGKWASELVLKASERIASYPEGEQAEWTISSSKNERVFFELDVLQLADFRYNCNRREWAVFTKRKPGPSVNFFIRNVKVVLIVGHIKKFIIK